MRVGVNTIGTVFCAVGRRAAPAASAEEAQARSTEDGRWIPSIAVTSGITIQGRDASVESDCENGGRAGAGLPAINLGDVSCNNPRPASQGGAGPAPLRPADGQTDVVTGTDLGVSPYVGGNLQLVTPVLEALPGRPRLFASGEILAFFPSERNVAEEGNPTGIAAPELTPDPTSFPAAAIGGAGSRTTSEVQTFGWGGQVGLAFPFEFRGRPFLVKPSAGWLHFGVDVEGIVLAGLKDDYKNNALPPGLINPPSPGAPDFAWTSGIREVALAGSASQSFNAFGPGLEIEMMTGRIGPFGSSLFVGGHAYRVVGNRSVRFSDTLSCRDPRAPSPGFVACPSTIPGATEAEITEDTYTAQWSFEVDPWVYRANVGFRLHWLGWKK